MVALSDGEEIMIRVHEAVLNEGGPTLLSKYQIRDHGLGVSDKAPQHGGSPHIELEPGRRLQLHMHGALAVLRVRTPTDEELRTLIPVDITSDDLWDPRKYDPGGGNIAQSPANTIRIHIAQRSRPLPEMDSTMTEDRQTRLSRVRFRKADVDKLIPKFIYRNRDIIAHTLENTTALAKNELRTPLRRHIKSRYPQMNVRRINETVASDTLFGSEPALGGFTCAQFFVGLTSDCTDVYPMHTESEGPDALSDFVRMIGAPHTIRTDNSKMQLGDEWKRTLRRMVIKHETTEPHHPWQNYAERRIGELKRQVNILLDRTGAPDDLWMLALQHTSYVWNRTALRTKGWRTPLELRTGDTPDISALLMYEFYEQVYFLDPSQPFPSTQERLGRMVGIAEHVGDALCYKVLVEDTRQVVHRSVVRPAVDLSRPNQRAYNKPISPTGVPSREVVKQHSETSAIAWIRLDGRTSVFHVDHPDSNTPPTATSGAFPDPLRHHESPLPAHTPAAGPLPDVDSPDPEQLLGKLFAMHHHNDVHTVAVTGVGTDTGGNTHVEILIRATEATQTMLYRKFIDALDPDAHPFIGIFGHLVTNETRGKWELRVLWATGEVTWEDLSSIWKSDPMTVAAYGRKHGLAHLKGWRRIRHVRGDPDKVVRLARVYQAATAALERKQPSRRYKFGVPVPNSVKDALYLDSVNGDTKWQEAIGKELGQIDEYATFRLATNDDDLSKYQRIPYHIIFDVKFDLRRKARLVAGGNHTAPPKEDVYSGVVGMDTVRLGFALAALYGLDVCAADVGNAYLYGHTNERVYISAGEEFGPERSGRPLIISKALYGLRSSGARWHEELASTLLRLGYIPSRADQNLWMKAVDNHYEYVATYVDDLLAFGKKPRDLIDTLRKKYTLKGVGEPEYYLGADLVDLTSLQWGGTKYGLSAKTYIGRLVEQIEQTLGTELRKCDSPLPEGYHPEQDGSPVLPREKAAVYRSITGALNWVVTLCRIDVAFANQLMARFNAAPREGHLKTVTRVVAYLKTWRDGMITFDPRPLQLGPTIQPVTHTTWGQFYPDATEEIPPDAPIGKGQAVQTTICVDADHATCTATRRSTTGIVVFVNSIPIRWQSKRQGTVEASTHGAEMVAARIATDAAVELRYGLRMLGVRLDGPTTMLCDNQSVVVNTSVPSSVLRKKHNAIAFHRIREAAAATIIVMTYIATSLNLADLLTKGLGRMKHLNFTIPLLFASLLMGPSSRSNRGMGFDGNKWKRTTAGRDDVTDTAPESNHTDEDANPDLITTNDPEPHGRADTAAEKPVTTTTVAPARQMGSVQRIRGCDRGLLDPGHTRYHRRGRRDVDHSRNNADTIRPGHTGLSPTRRRLRTADHGRSGSDTRARQLLQPDCGRSSAIDDKWRNHKPQYGPQSRSGGNGSKTNRKTRQRPDALSRHDRPRTGSVPPGERRTTSSCDRANGEPTHDIGHRHSTSSLGSSPSLRIRTKTSTHQRQTRPTERDGHPGMTARGECQNVTDGRTVTGRWTDDQPGRTENKTG